MFSSSLDKYIDRIARFCVGKVLTSYGIAQLCLKVKVLSYISLQ